ncbi:MAG: zf-HC2 domain-containing protein, partial [Bryobacteraceae bacterium]
MTPGREDVRQNTLGECSAIERLLVFYACEEAGPDERAIVEEHVGNCGACAALLAAELRLRQMLTTLPQPADRLDQAGALLAQCRSELAEILDDAEEAHREFRHNRGTAKWFSWMRMELAMHPALAAGVFILIGLSVGRLLPASANLGVQQSGIVPALKVSANPRLSDQELQNIAVSGIDVVPDPTTGAPSVE